MKKKNKMKDKGKKLNIFKFVGVAIKTTMIVFMAMFALIVCLQRFSDNNISIFKYRMFSVATGSMKPKYLVGDVILCKEVDVRTLKVGDDITYKGKSGTFKDKTVTHRIVKIDDSDSEIRIYTKGIASTRIDPVVTEEQVYGKIVTKFEFLSWLYKFITTPTGFYMCIFIPIAILFGSEIISMSVEKYEEKMTKR